MQRKHGVWLNWKLKTVAIWDDSFTVWHILWTCWLINSMESLLWDKSDVNFKLNWHRFYIWINLGPFRSPFDGTVTFIPYNSYKNVTTIKIKVHRLKIEECSSTEMAKQVIEFGDRLCEHMEQTQDSSIISKLTAISQKKYRVPSKWQRGYFHLTLKAQCHLTHNRCWYWCS